MTIFHDFFPVTLFPPTINTPFLIHSYSIIYIHCLRFLLQPYFHSWLIHTPALFTSPVIATSLLYSQFQPYSHSLPYFFSCLIYIPCFIHMPALFTSSALATSLPHSQFQHYLQPLPHSKFQFYLHPQLYLHPCQHYPLLSVFIPQPTLQKYFDRNPLNPTTATSTAAVQQE